MARGSSNPDGGAIRFVMGGKPRTLEDVDPNMTVLNWLRYDERRVGTKEGCAEGDCGACTVVLGELDGKRLRYRAVNACIQFVPTLDGKELITVEDLRAPDGALHPVQQAMVDCHGSQCGFCTPGFVMSLFAFGKSGAVPTRGAIDDAIAGNLCRCTGYRPIAAAARQISREDHRRDRFARREKETVRQLEALRRDDTLALAWRGRRYYAPRSGDALAALLAEHPDAVLLAGGTDAGLWVTKQHRDLDTLIYTGAADDLRRVAVTDAAIEIGAAATYTDMAAAIAADYPDFGEVLRRLGSVQIRNAGTMGGNIANASPIGDTMPLLIALGATLVLRKGERRREMALDDFFTGYRKTRLTPGEFIETIRLPRPRPSLAFRAYKISKRFDQDISAVCAGFALDLADGRVKSARLAFGGMAAVPKRAAQAEAALTGKPWTLASVQAAMAAIERDFQPLDDMRASAAYRMGVARNLLHKLYLETTGPAIPSRAVAFGA